MVREFKEETSAASDAMNWLHVATITYTQSKAKVHIFGTCNIPFALTETVTDEIVLIARVHDCTLQNRMVRNAYWLMLLARGQVLHVDPPITLEVVSL